MNTDFRLKLSFFEHPKTKKTRFILGDFGVLGVIRLFAHAAANKPDGVLSNMDEVDIAIAAGWEGKAEALVGCLVKVGFLEKSKGKIYRIHDWEDHNPWAAGASDRSEHARQAADARWKKTQGRSINRPDKKQRVKQKENAPGKNEHSAEHDRALPNSQMSNAPSPYPSPIPSPKPYPSPPQEPLSQVPIAVEGKHRARATAPPAKFDYSKWHPDEACFNRIRLADPDITNSFIGQVRLEFITWAEDNRLSERLMRSRFLTRVHAKWLEAKARESRDDSSDRSVADIRRVPNEHLETWVLAQGGPRPNTGETYDEYRARAAAELRVASRRSNGPQSVADSLASAVNG